MEKKNRAFDPEFKENAENGHSPNSFVLNDNERSIWSSFSLRPLGNSLQNAEPANDGWSQRAISATEIIGCSGHKVISSNLSKRKLSVSDSCEFGGAFDGSSDSKFSSDTSSETESFFNKRSPPNPKSQRLFDYELARPKSSNGSSFTQVSFTANSSGNAAPSSSVNLFTGKAYFQPIASNPGPSSLSPSDSVSPVDLSVTNLDQTTSITEMKRTLTSLFSECTTVSKMTLHVQSDGNLVAVVRVPSHQDAQYVISQLHRKRVGQRKILISYSQSNVVPIPEHYKSHIRTLLSEVPYCKLPLSKFMELLESRYSINIAVSDLSRMKEICSITIENGLRMVTLASKLSSNATFPSMPTPQAGKEIEPLCVQHFKIPCNPSIGWAEQRMAPLPSVNVSLSVFSANVHALLATHNYMLPLASLYFCYVETCGELNVTEEGVPLEHLVTCVKDVELKSIDGMKFLQPIPSHSTPEKTTNELDSCISPSLAPNLSQFKGELVKFLKTLPRAQILFNKFIPGYHRHFNKQCRVADFGFTRLIDLLEALPNTVQVLGEGGQKVVTLAHAAQVRRFSSELQRVLKVQPMRKLPLAEIPEQFESVLERPFSPVDYGLCSLSDLLSCVSSNTAVVVNEDGCEMVSLFIREPTVEEKRRTKIFAKEVVELFRQATNCSVILFEKFVPMYHHHFGYQCRVSDYGYTRLIDLFEGISDIVEMGHDEAGQRTIILTLEKKLEVLGEQIREIVMPSGLPLSYLPSAFLWQHGYTLKPEEYGEPNLESLMRKIPFVTLKSNTVEPTEASLLKHISVQVRKLLINSEDGVATPAVLATCFSSYPQHHLRLKALVRLMPETVQISRSEFGAPQLQLTPLYYIVRRVVSLLNHSKGHLSLKLLESNYLREYDTDIRPQSYGFSGINEFLKAIPRDVWTIYGKGRKRLIILGEGIIYREKRNSTQTTIERRSSDAPPERAAAGAQSFPKFPIDKFKLCTQRPIASSQRFEDEPTASAASNLPNPYVLFAENSNEHSSDSDDSAWPPLLRSMNRKLGNGRQPNN